MSRPTVLCVDDEPRVLDGLRRILHGTYDVAVATSGRDALARFEVGEGALIVVSDMRMPGMTGAELFGELRRRAPDTVRILLTGQSDLDAAILAVNDGQIFRFLTKPCPPDALFAALAAAVEQHRLVTAERELLEKTLVGSIRAMTDVLALAHPSAFAPIMRQHARARKVAERIGVPDAWRVEVASMLGSLGFVVLPERVLQRLRRAEPLTPPERAMLAELPAVAERVISNIPRLEGVLAVVRHQSSWLGKPPEAAGSARELPTDAAVLRAVHDLGVAEERAGNTRDAVTMLRGHADLYEPSVLDALFDVCGEMPKRLLSLKLSEARTGMVLAEDLLLDSGVLLVARGQTLTEHILLRLTHNYAGRVREPLRCEPPDR